MKNLVIVLSFAYSIVVFAQSSNENNAILLPQGYGIKLLNSACISSIFNDVSNIGFMNPASISMFENYSLGFSYQFSSSINEAWVADFGTSRVYNFYPQSFGGIVKWNNFSFGLGFGQRYNGTLDTDPIPVSNIQNPDGTGEFISVITENTIQNYSLSSDYSFKEVLETSFDIHLGFKYSLNRFNQFVKIWEMEANATGYYSNFGIGIYSEFILNQERNLDIGLSYESANKFRANIEYDNPPVLYDLDPVNNQDYAIVVLPSLLYNTPSELSFGLAIDATSDLKFLTNLSSVFWESSYEYVKDQIEYSASAVFALNENYTSSLGIYFTDYKYKDNFYSRLNGELGAFFITAGLKFNHDIFYADLAFADSHLFSGDFRKQTIGKLAIGVHL